MKRMRKFLALNAMVFGVMVSMSTIAVAVDGVNPVAVDWVNAVAVDGVKGGI